MEFYIIEKCAWKWAVIGTINQSAGQILRCPVVDRWWWLGRQGKSR